MIFGQRSELQQQILRDMHWMGNFFRNTPAGFEYTDDQLLEAFEAYGEGADAVTVSDEIRLTGSVRPRETTLFLRPRGTPTTRL